VYITTKGELSKLRTSSEKKKDLDRLWLELMSGNIKVAKRSIREYYRRVKLANKFFTTYKPGWKTDKGMVFIVFGNPSRVVRTQNKEMWTYAQNASFSDIHFTFLRTPNQFVDNHYNLVRYPEYEQVWYPKIEQWREGKIGS
jgi:GWxTD domain-containing protein